MSRLKIPKYFRRSDTLGGFYPFLSWTEAFQSNCQIADLENRAMIDISSQKTGTGFDPEVLECHNITQGPTQTLELNAVPWSLAIGKSTSLLRRYSQFPATEVWSSLLHGIGFRRSGLLTIEETPI